MGAYLITGRSGTGKSAICRELQKRGYQAFDADTVPGLGSWIDRETGQKLGAEYPGHEHIGNKFKWKWDRKTMDALLEQPGDIFVCGSANNSFEFLDSFDGFFMLNLTPDEQRSRILNRTEHDYGKDPQVLDSIIEYQEESVKIAAEHGAIVIDAMPSVEQIVDDILSRLS